MFKKVMKADIFGYSWKKRLEVTGITLLTSVGALGVGFGLDKLVGTEKPIFAAVFFILSYPLCQYFLYKRYARAKSRTQTPEPVEPLEAPHKNLN